MALKKLNEQAYTIYDFDFRILLLAIHSELEYFFYISQPLFVFVITTKLFCYVFSRIKSLHAWVVSEYKILLSNTIKDKRYPRFYFWTLGKST